MRAELVFMGRRVDMARRARRRGLVVAIYAGLVLLIVGSWFLDHWRVTTAYLLFATIAVNRLFLRGQYFGGLIKPFKGKPPRRVFGELSFAFPLVLKLGLYRPEPDESEFRNDERETHQRDRAHYLAYAPLSLGLCLLWLASDWSLHTPKLLTWIPMEQELVVPGLIQVLLVMFLTLPQAILLWTEPDMEDAG